MRHSLLSKWLCVFIFLLCLKVFVFAQQVLQFGFEGKETFFRQGKSDASISLMKHQLSDESAHTGQKSELIQFTAGNGQFAHFFYDFGQAQVTDELNISLWVKANRPGMQLFCRVILPKERDPKNLDQPLTLTTSPL